MASHHLDDQSPGIPNGNGHGDMRRRPARGPEPPAGHEAEEAEEASDPRDVVFRPWAFADSKLEQRYQIFCATSSSRSSARLLTWLVPCCWLLAIQQGRKIWRLAEVGGADSVKISFGVAGLSVSTVAFAVSKFESGSATDSWRITQVALHLFSLFVAAHVVVFNSSDSYILILAEVVIVGCFSTDFRHRAFLQTVTTMIRPLLHAAKVVVGSEDPSIQLLSLSLGEDAQYNPGVRRVLRDCAFSAACLFFTGVWHAKRRQRWLKINENRAADDDDEIAEVTEELAAENQAGGAAEAPASGAENGVAVYQEVEQEARPYSPELSPVGIADGEDGQPIAFAPSTGPDRESRPVLIRGVDVSWDYLDDGYFTEDERVELTSLVREEIAEIQAREQDAKSGEQLYWHRGKRVLGHGSCGIIHLAIDNESGQFMAVREVSINASSAKLIRSVAQELRTLKRLSHPHIVAYKGSCVRDGKMCALMELCDSGNIASILCKFGALDTGLCRRYTTHIVSGVGYLHRHCIVHRDIKCTNCLVTADGIVKLSDFGHVKQLKEAVSSSLHGTMQYMAPEILTSSKIVRQSDIWSLGCCVAEMLTGTLLDPTPFDPTKKSSWQNTDFCASILPKDCAEEAKAFIRQCLQVDYRQRPSAKRLSKHEFIYQNIPEDSTIDTTPSDTGDRELTSDEPTALPSDSENQVADGAGPASRKTWSVWMDGVCRTLEDTLFGRFAQPGMENEFRDYMSAGVLDRVRPRVLLFCPMLFASDLMAYRSLQNEEMPLVIFQVRVVYLLGILYFAFFSDLSRKDQLFVFRTWFRLSLFYVLNGPWSQFSLYDLITVYMMASIVSNALPLRDIVACCLLYLLLRIGDFVHELAASYKGLSVLQEVERLMARSGTCFVIVGCMLYALRFAIHRERVVFKKQRYETDQSEPNSEQNYVDTAGSSISSEPDQSEHSAGSNGSGTWEGTNSLTTGEGTSHSL